MGVDLVTLHGREIVVVAQLLVELFDKWVQILQRVKASHFCAFFFFKSLLFPGSFLSTATEGLVLLWMGRTMYRHRTRREEELSVEELQKLEMALCISGFLSRPCSPVCDTMLMIKVKLHCRCSYVRLFFFFRIKLGFFSCLFFSLHPSLSVFFFVARWGPI